MKEMLLQTATVLSGTIVFMKNDENTRTADSHPAITISTGDLDSGELGPRRRPRHFPSNVPTPHFTSLGGKRPARELTVVVGERSVRITTQLLRIRVQSDRKSTRLNS